MGVSNWSTCLFKKRLRKAPARLFVCFFTWLLDCLLAWLPDVVAGCSFVCVLHLIVPVRVIVCFFVSVCLCFFVCLFVCFSPPDRKGLLDFMLESAFAMLLHHAPTQYPARAARQWIPPSIPPEQLASGSRRVSPAKYAPE